MFLNAQQWGLSIHVAKANKDRSSSVVAGFSFHIALCSCIIVIKPGYETRLLDISPQLPPQSEDKSNDVTMSLLSDLFWYSEIWGEKRNHLSFNPLVKKRSSGVWSERMLTPYYPPVTSMTSVCPGCPSELAACTSRQSAWPAATLYVLTASLCKLNVFACVCVCVCVCMPVFARVFTVCMAAAMADGVSVGVGGTMSSVLLSVGLWVAELQALTCVISWHQSRCVGPVWPVDRGHISSHMLAGGEWCSSEVLWEV